MFIRDKVIIAGRHATHYEYLEGQVIGHTGPAPSGSRSQRWVDTDTGESFEGFPKGHPNEGKIQKTGNPYDRTEYSLARTRRTIKQLVNANAKAQLGLLMTLTYKENMRDEERSSADWTKFIRKLEKGLGRKLEYLHVRERQKRGAIHFHVIIFNLTLLATKTILKNWPHGTIVDCRKIEYGPKLAHYITKYLVKDGIPLKKGMCLYATSKGLKRAKILINVSALAVLGHLGSPTWQKEVEVGGLKLRMATYWLTDQELKSVGQLIKDYDVLAEIDPSRLAQQGTRQALQNGFRAQLLPAYFEGIRQKYKAK